MSKTSSRRHPHKLRACVQFLRSNGDCDSRICSDRSSILQPTISYDRPGVLAAFSKQHGITFPLLSDVGSATIKWYGILNPVPEWAIGPDKDDPEVKAAVQKYVSVVNPNPSMVGIAFPGTFILDRQGRVTSRYFEDFYIERNTISSIMTRLNNRVGPVAGTKVSTAQ